MATVIVIRKNSRTSQEDDDKLVWKGQDLEGYNLKQLCKMFRKEVEAKKLNNKNIRKDPIYQQIKKLTKTTEDIDHLIPLLNHLYNFKLGENLSELFKMTCEEESLELYSKRIKTIRRQDEKEHILRWMCYPQLREGNLT